MFLNGFIEDMGAYRGRKWRSLARQLCIETLPPLHNDFSVRETVLHIYDEVPFLGASPDGLVKCQCHSNNILE